MFEVTDDYIKWGHYEDIKTLLSGDEYTSIFVSGLSGNGKTSMIKRISSEIGKKFFRVNIIGTTDEDDLIGGYELVNGDTVWVDRAVVEAMQEGGILLLDEIDLGTERLMCLQSILEGEGVFVKKQNKFVTPKDGFSIVATANTKGRGNEDGRFVGTNIMNEAMLDRFDFTFEQNYPDFQNELKILYIYAKKYKIDNHSNIHNLLNNLCVWSRDLRKTYEEGGILNDVISTRRLISIIKAYSKYGKIKKSLQISLARYDKDTQEAFITYYSKIDDLID